MTGSSGESYFGVMYGGWYAVCDFVVFSVVELCVDYGVVYVVGVCANVCGVVCVVRFLRLSVVGVWDVVIFIVFVMRIVGGVPLWVACVSCKYCVFMSVVHRVANLNAVFCVICSLLMFVSDASGHHGGNVLEYGSCYGFVCCEDRFRLFPHV